MARAIFCTVYAVEDDTGDSPTGEYFFPTLAQARQHRAAMIAAWHERMKPFAQDMHENARPPKPAIHRIPVIALPARELACRMLNHSGYAYDTPRLVV